MTRPVSTYSIVAVDDSGTVGAAVQSHSFSVGSVVPHAASGVGAVASQSVTDPGHGSQILTLLSKGLTPAEAAESVLEGDPERRFRQFGIVAPGSAPFAFTGTNCIEAAGHHAGATCAAQANLMERDTVWDAMASAFESVSGTLGERLVAALEAAEQEGGDLRGKQSASLIVVTSDGGRGRKLFDLRVDDHDQPLVELRRLMGLQTAYNLMTDGDSYLAAGQSELALDAYRQSADMLPDAATDGEAAFWTGMSLAAQGEIAEARRYVARAHAQDACWAVLAPRLVKSGLVPGLDSVEALIPDRAAVNAPAAIRESSR